MFATTVQADTGIVELFNSLPQYGFESSYHLEYGKEGWEGVDYVRGNEAHVDENAGYFAILDDGTGGGCGSLKVQLSPLKTGAPCW